MGKRFNILKLGALLGGILGVLFAPKSGKETRKDLKNFAEEHKKEIDTTVEISKKGLEKAKQVAGDLDTKKIKDKIGKFFKKK